MTIKQKDREAIAAAIATWREACYTVIICDGEMNPPFHPNFVTVQKVNGFTDIVANGVGYEYCDAEEEITEEGLNQLIDANPTIEYKLQYVSGKVAVLKMRISDTAKILESWGNGAMVDTKLNGIWLVNMLSYTPGKWQIVSMMRTYGEFDEEGDGDGSVTKINRSKTKKELYEEEKMRMRGEPVDEDPDELKEMLAEQRAEIRDEIERGYRPPEVSAWEETEDDGYD